MKRPLYFLLSIFIVAVLLFVLWNNRSILNRQPVLSNKDYPLQLDSIKTIRKQLRQRHANPNELEHAFITLMNARVLPYWYGTKWDFYGTTETPNEGSIACGYFVTTVLRDMGVPVNRVKMAQCASEEMIRSLVSKPHIHHLSNMDIGTFEKRMQKLGKGFYIVGLDNHTGFLLISEGGNYFIHSSGAFPFQVIKERISESLVLGKSVYRVVGKISADKTFLQNWLAQK